MEKAMVRRVYNNGVFGVKKSLDIEKVIFLQAGDKVPGDFVDFQLILSGTLPISFLDTQPLFEIGCSSNEPGFTYKVVSIPYGTYINKEEMIVERY
jgi:hypothetical protein